jgi:hypothetical protein
MLKFHVRLLGYDVLKGGGYEPCFIFGFKTLIQSCNCLSLPVNIVLQLQPKMRIMSFTLQRLCICVCIFSVTECFVVSFTGFLPVR